jgi:hypothetical protein
MISIDFYALWPVEGNGPAIDSSLMDLLLDRCIALVASSVTTKEIRLFSV